jgi:hypothetical protein
LPVHPFSAAPAVPLEQQMTGEHSTEAPEPAAQLPPIAPAKEAPPAPSASPAASTAKSKPTAAVETPLTAAAFAGSYSGNDTTLKRLVDQGEEREDDPNAKVTIQAKSEQQVDITIVDSGNGGPICTMRADITGSIARIGRDQECFSEATATASVSSGSARLDGNRLTLELVLDYEEESETGSRTGKIDYHFEGSRK